jgi:formylglycine-generating enzyme required for sulfatase activity
VRAPLVRSEDVARLSDFALFRDCEVCPEMVVLPAGSFLMGSPESEVGRQGDESPQHEVNVGRLAVGRFEITGAEWGDCGDACAQTAAGRGRHPATAMNWREAQGFVRWLNARGSGEPQLVSAAGSGPYRLLSEAEWEYAARAGSNTRFSWGDEDPICDETAANGAVFWGCGEPTTFPVGSFRPNSFGLFDMYGNVFEWCEDAWNPDYNGAPSDGSAWRTGDASLRAIRGGSWSQDAEQIRSAFRYKFVTGEESRALGLRVARTL